MKIMKKTRRAEILKVVAVSALAIGAFSTTLIGANNRAFAMATNETQTVPATAQAVSVTPNLPSEGFQMPNFNVVSSPLNNIHVNNTVTASAMPMEAAAELGAQYIWDVFGESIDDMYIELMFANWPSQSRTYWLGIVFPSDPGNMDAYDFSRHGRISNELYRFLIDAVTGLRIDISPGFGYMPLSSYEEERWANGRCISDEVLAWHIAWDEMTTTARMEYLGISQADLDPYLQIAREFARRHFNNSVPIYETESFDVQHNMVNRFAIDSAELGGVTFRISDDTGREAEIWIDAETRSLRPGLGIATRDNDFIPGFSYESYEGIG
jgi:hypothetical protein